MVLVPPVEHTVVDSLRIEEAWPQQQARPGPPGAHVTFILQSVLPSVRLARRSPGNPCLPPLPPPPPPLT